MKIGNKKLFTTNSQKLYEALMLRKIGWSFDSIAVLYECDRTSIRDQARKYVILPPQNIFRIERIARDIIFHHNPHPKTEWKVINGERVCLGRSYKDYISP